MRVWNSIFSILAAICTLGLLSSCEEQAQVGELDSPAAPSELRIVTMAPSSGEVAYLLGLSDQVVGVSRFTKYPPEFVEKPKIGGYLDVDTEAIIRLKADVVVLLKEQADLAKQLEQFGMRTVMVDHMSLDGIVESIRIMGEAFGNNAEAKALVSEFQSRIDVVKAAAQQGEQPTMLLSIGREVGQGKVTGLVAAGAAGVHQELLEAAGFRNAYAGAESFPQITREHIIRMNPTVVVDMVNGDEVQRLGINAILDDWEQYQELDAVRYGRVFVLAGDQHYVPGPRLGETLEWLAARRREALSE